MRRTRRWRNCTPRWRSAHSPTRASRAPMSTAISAPAMRPGPARASMAEYMNLKLRHAESTELGGASYIVLASHAAEAIAAGKCDVALVTLAGRPRSEGMATGTAPRPRDPNQPEGGLGGALRHHHGERLRHGRDAPHARVRHHERAARLGQGRRLASRAIQSARHAARGSDRRGRGELADDRFPAASARLLRDQRRRRRDRHRSAGDRQKAQAAAGQDHRRRRGGKASQPPAPSISRRRARRGPGRSPSPRPG